MPMKELRWQQRFENFEKAFFLLKEPFESKNLAEFSQLEFEGIAQRFEFTVELAWKTLKDYMQNEGVILEKITPKTVLKEAFALKIIENGDIWIDMLLTRNYLSHVYDEKHLTDAIKAIHDNYLKCFLDLYNRLKSLHD